MVDDDGQIWIGDTRVDELAQRYGTPIYVYDANQIISNYRLAINSLRRYYDNSDLYYAIKACNNPAIASLLVAEGAGIDAASAIEVKLARQLGVPGSRIMFTGSSLCTEDFAEALSAGATPNLDDVSALPALLSLGTPEAISFRVNPMKGAYTGSGYGRMSGGQSKFGIQPHEVLPAYRAARDAGVTSFGVHGMTGSCVLDPHQFAHFASDLLDLVGPVFSELGLDLSFVDLGGGLGIPYRPDETPLDVDLVFKEAVAVILTKCQQHRLAPPRILMEPARFFVGNAGMLIGRVQVIKNRDVPIIGTDISMNVFARPALYGEDAAHHDIHIDGKSGEPTAEFAVCGQVCENTDLWLKSRQLPATVGVGDLLVVMNTGAYGYSMSYGYNGRLRPAEVLVTANTHRLIRRRETFDDFLATVV